MDDLHGEAATTRETIAYCAELARPYRGLLLGAAAFLFLAVVVQDVASPLVFAAVLDRIATIKRGETLWGRFGTLIVAYAVLLLLGQVLMRMAGWLEWEGSLKTFTHGIHRSFERLLGLGYRWHIDHPAGEVASSLSAFSWALVDGIDTLEWSILRILVIVLSAVVVLGVVAWPVAVVLVALTGVFVAVVVKRSGPVTEASRDFSRAHSRAEGTASDVIRNVSTVLVGAGEHAESARVRELLDGVVRADLRARRQFTVTRVWMGGTIAAMTWGALFVGVVLALRGDIRSGVVYLVLFYASTVSQELITSFQEIRNLVRGLGRAGKLVHLVSTEPEVVDAPGAADLVVPEGALRFDHVRFSYRPDRPLLADFELEVRPGEHVGVVGPSGSGKSTVTRLVLRLMDLQGGRILIDDQDIAGCTQSSLRRAVSYVPQDPQMLHRSIAENIWYGQDGEPDLDRIRAVADAAFVDEFVKDLPEGYETIVGERGLKLSGGQRQRVAIAQAMLKNAPILILDEATSSLDSESERYVQEALWRLMAGSTALVVAHRLSTIAHLDRIIVVEGGRIVETGSHRELLLTSPVGTYRELWEHQSGGFLSA
ncbi:ATP-binding cassette domain-containing protein [Acidimicrobiaceae bacterium USS-CC1]|uniref:ATP-binding cassette domain-containing protein n=1 Tax=Acidiferrimicrobium australe TaxID=2664430 RepID=A0ABW9QTP2_9ACTN|nr:ATP-binding cassette domain-containing protein [Acidiferrimicrobium australe]